MSTKVKGLIKGLKYISHQIFEEEKEAEIQIGFPTDVKHVAHIGWDGPSTTTDNPSWMNEFKGAGSLKSAPLGPPTDSKENTEIKWVSEDSKGRRAPRSENRDAAGAEGSTKPRRHSCDNTAAAAAAGGGDSPKSSKPRQSRRSKASSDGAKIKDPSAADGPDVPKKTRRKKSKDFNADGSVRSSRTSKTSAPATAASAADQSSQDTSNTDPPPSSTSSKPQEDGENPVLF